MDANVRWPAVLGTMGGLRQWFEDHGYAVAQYTDERIVTALLAASPASGPHLWLSTRHVERALEYLRTH